jgi:hypothetical protein
MNVLEVDKRYKALFDGIGLSDFEAFMTTSAGDTIASESLRETRKLDIEGHTFFLKRVKKAKFSSAVEAVLQGRRPHSYAWREMQHVEQLQLAGIPVMTVAAVGERRYLGLPKEGFIVVVGIEGDDLELVFRSSNDTGKSIIMRQLGALNAQLHVHGFLKPIRLKDLIITPSQKLVLIDRETRNPFPRRFSQERALQSLIKAGQRQHRDGVKYSEADNLVMLKAYYQGCSQLWPETEQAFLEKALKALS